MAKLSRMTFTGIDEQAKRALQVACLQAGMTPSELFRRLLPAIIKYAQRREQGRESEGQAAEAGLG